MSLKTSFLAILLAAAAYSQSSPPAADDQPDPEDRNHGVARISLMNGDVSVRRGDSGDYVAGNINAPLLAGDSIQTGQASRAEVQFDFASRMRLGQLSEVRMGDLRTGAFQMQIARGFSTFSLLADNQTQIEISTPSASIRPMRRGAYRVAVLDDGTTQVTVRAGEADIYTPQGSQRVAAGQTMMLRGNANDPEYQIIPAIARDEWDQFNETRDRELSRSTAYQHVSRDISGAEDLDQYGRWNNDPTYGDVWTPNVAADWAPYQSGRWAWEDYYGWTWVSYDPWGWAPYHYGRWFRGGLGWSWVPGPIYGSYGYRPALVGFFGFGGGAGFGFGGGFGFGNLGWVALAPFERFHPWYGRGFGERGFTNVNIYNTYRNARVSNGVMGMSAQQFQSGQFGRYSHPGAAQLQNGGALNGRLPVTPTNANLRFNERQTAFTPRSGGAQNFVSRGGFAPVQRQSFEQQRQSLQQNLSTPRSAQGTNQNWQRFGATGGANARPASQSAQSGAGWGRFGTPESSRQSTGSESYGRSSNSQSYSSPSRNFAGSSTAGRSVQIAPPIVQQRSSGNSSAPAARQSAPAPSRPANNGSGHSGGGSSSGHSSGGGGGGGGGQRGR